MKNIFLIVLLFYLKVNLTNSNAVLLGPCPIPNEFPSSIQLSVRSFQNYDGQIKVPFAYFIVARNPEDVVKTSNWAYKEGYRIRAIGKGHSWAPLHFSPSETDTLCPKTILVDTTQHLTSKDLNPTDFGRPDLYSVTVGPGLTLLNLLEFLEKHGLGLYSSPAIGSITVGGMLAVGAHGSGAWSKHDSKSPGHSYGTLSNLVIEIEIVAWNNATKSYRLKTLHRWDKDCKAFLTSLGRTFITSVTLRVGKNQMLRSKNHFNVASKEFFANPNNNFNYKRTLSSFVEKYGRTESVVLPFGQSVLVMTWKAEPIKPLESREVSNPFNLYGLQNALGVLKFFEPLIKKTLQISSNLAKLFGFIGYPLIRSSLQLTRTDDYWGPSKNHLLFYPSYSPKVTANSITIVTSRANLQLIVSIIKSHHDALSNEFANRNEFPFVLDFEIRVTGIDEPEDVEIFGAETPSLSPASLVSNNSEYDTVIWMESVGYPDVSLGMKTFYTKLQERILIDVHGKYGIFRPEWAKAWAHTYEGAWKNLTMMKRIIPRSFSTSHRLEEWNWAVKTLNHYDPFRIFSNDFLDNLLIVY